MHIGDGSSECYLESDNTKISDDLRSCDGLDSSCYTKADTVVVGDCIKSEIGVDCLNVGERIGWLLTFASSYLEDESCLDLYFISQDGSTFKVKHRFQPYFYVSIKDDNEAAFVVSLWRLFGRYIDDTEYVEKQDFVASNGHACEHKSYLKISFDSIIKLKLVRRALARVIRRREETSSTPQIVMDQGIHDLVDCIFDLCESDVPYHVRFAIDKDIRCGQWYDISVSCDGIFVERRIDQMKNPEFHVCAFNIHTTKLRLKDPDADWHSIMMISYIIDGQGYLLINKEYVVKDLKDFECTPKPEFKCRFKVKNANDEKGLLSLWFAEMKEVKPNIYVTYKGDCFDWPFLESKAAKHGYSMSEELGFHYDKRKGECRAKSACHLDCFAWVKRDSHRRKGKQGLMSVAYGLLGIYPSQDITKDVVRFAKDKPNMLASYFVSDVVSTYYLYKRHVHPFIFSLSTVIPMPPDELLRVRSSFIIDTLLMLQAYRDNAIYHNNRQQSKQKSKLKIPDLSQLLFGGKVGCLENFVNADSIRRYFYREYDLSSCNNDIDRLSGLPLDILTSIFACLNYKYVVRASCLAKYYRDLWKLSPRLDFVYHRYGAHSQDHILHSLKSRADLSLTVFSLAVGTGGSGCFVDCCVDYARLHKVQHLKLSFQGRLSLKMHHIKLHRSFLLSGVVRICLRKYTFYRDNIAGPALLSLCPCIEEFILDECGANYDFKCFDIKSLSLKRLSIRNWKGLCSLVGKQVINVSAPGLLFFSIEGAFLNLTFGEPMAVIETAIFDLTIPGGELYILDLDSVLRSFLSSCWEALCKDVKTIHVSPRTTKLINSLGVIPFDFNGIFNNLKTIKFTYSEKSWQKSFPTDAVKHIVDKGTGVDIIFDGSELKQRLPFEPVPFLRRGAMVSVLFLDFMLMKSPFAEEWVFESWPIHLWGVKFLK